MAVSQEIGFIDLGTIGNNVKPACGDASQCKQSNANKNAGVRSSRRHEFDAQSSSAMRL
jgi:hypothetical protein